MNLTAPTTNNSVSSANLQAAKKSCEFWLTSEKIDGKEGKSVWQCRNFTPS